MAVASNLSKKNFRYSLSLFFSASPHLLSLPQSLISLPSDSSSKTLHSNHVFSFLFSLNPNIRFFNGIRWFSVSSSVEFSRPPDGFRTDVRANRVSGIVESIISCDNDFESKLNVMMGDERLPFSSVIEILMVLNSVRISAIPFFNWIRRWQPGFCLESDICSLVIDNCGRLGDFETMFCLLNDFMLNNVNITRKAFQFLPVMVPSDASVKKDSVRKVVELLNEVGGSSRTSGVRSLVEMFSMLGSFELARYVLLNTRPRVPYYNVLLKEMCRRCDFEGVRGVLDEMRQMGCDPNVQTYNYILSNLCKQNKLAEACQLMKEMQETDCALDALTFEIFISYLCPLGKLDFSVKLLDIMELRGIEPRLGIHAAFIRGYWNLGHYEMAHKYVVSSSDKYKWPSNKMYDLLACLHHKKGNMVAAQNILSEMMKKGLRPSLGIYRKLLEHLGSSGRDDSHKSLENSCCDLSLQSSTSTDDG